MITADVVDIFEVISNLKTKFQDIACIKLNIEGGEYEVLERIISTGIVSQFRSIIMQYHAQPEGWQKRRESIEQQLCATHECVWAFPMIWEKWIRK